MITSEVIEDHELLNEIEYFILHCNKVFIMFSDHTGKYNVYKLWQVTDHLDIQMVRTAKLRRNLQQTQWPVHNNTRIEALTVGEIYKNLDKHPEHEQKIQHADLSYPILVSPKYEIYDGMHRLCKCLLEKRPTIRCRIVSQEILKLAKVNDRPTLSPGMSISCPPKLKTT